jgi:hypothetical protein
MKEIFEGIAWLFENVLFVPYDALRQLQLTSWFAANIMNWIFLVVGLSAFIYWMLQLKKYNDNNEEDRDPTAHSFLG